MYPKAVKALLYVAIHRRISLMLFFKIWILLNL